MIGSKCTDMCDDCFVWSNNIRKLQKDVSGECDPEKLAKLGKDRQNIIAQCQQHFRHVDAQKERIESAIEKSKNHSQQSTQKLLLHIYC